MYPQTTWPGKQLRTVRTCVLWHNHAGATSAPTAPSRRAILLVLVIVVIGIVIPFRVCLRFRYHRRTLRQDLHSVHASVLNFPDRIFFCVIIPATSRIRIIAVALLVS
jgi:hypothetical protein